MKKITRDSFIYLEPKKEKENFAQCATCKLWTGKTCLILGKTKVTGEMSCCYYIPGTPSKGSIGKEQSLLTPKEAGLVNRKVRCENCRSFKNGICMLYQKLNQSNADIFDLNEKVNKYGCCNAQEPKEG